MTVPGNDLPSSSPLTPYHSRNAAFVSYLVYKCQVLQENPGILNLLFVGLFLPLSFITCMHVSHFSKSSKLTLCTGISNCIVVKLFAEGKDERMD